MRGCVKLAGAVAVLAACGADGSASANRLGPGGSEPGVGGSVPDGSGFGGSGSAGGSGAGGAGVDGGGTGGSDDGSVDSRLVDGAPAEGEAGVYDPCPPKGTPCSIMALGDSITAGVGGSGGSYRPWLFHLALSHEQTITFVGSGMNGPAKVDNVVFPKGNEGHPGYTIDDISGHTGIHDLTAPAMQKFHPNIITLMIGTNDIANSLDLANAPSRLAGLLDTITSSDPEVLLVVAQIIPTGNDAANVRARAFNNAIPALVKARTDAGQHVIMVDVYDAFAADANYKRDLMSDALHPNDTGYVKMAEVWYAAIGRLFR
jgi:lysophospholipase L1-like esterase